MKGGARARGEGLPPASPPCPAWGAHPGVTWPQTQPLPGSSHPLPGRPLRGFTEHVFIFKVSFACPALRHWKEKKRTRNNPSGQARPMYPTSPKPSIPRTQALHARARPEGPGLVWMLGLASRSAGLTGVVGGGREAEGGGGFASRRRPSRRSVQSLLEGPRGPARPGAGGAVRACAVHHSPSPGHHERSHGDVRLYQASGSHRKCPYWSQVCGPGEAFGLSSVTGAAGDRPEPSRLVRPLILAETPGADPLPSP